MTRIGAVFHPNSQPPEALRDIVRIAEDSGVPELWVWEDCFREAAFAQASAALAWSERLRVGIGIAPMPLRNVALTAMEIATVERMFPGRLIPGVGHGVLDWMGQVGARVASPLTLMREYVPALRALVAGEKVTVSGRYVNLDSVQLDWAPMAPPPIIAAAEGPKTLAVSGEVADGTALVSGSPVEHVAASIKAARDARSDAGRDGHHEVIAYVLTAFGGDDAAERARRDLAKWTSEDGADRVVTGTVEDVAAAVRRYAAAGVDAVILQPTIDEPDTRGFFEATGEVARLIETSA